MTTKLKLDYDGIDEDDVARIFYHRGWLLDELGLVKLEASKTARGFHVAVEVQATLTDADIILAQILLGSDLYREIYNFVHHANGQLASQWNKLFDKKFIILGTQLKEISHETSSPNLTQRLVEQSGKKPRPPWFHPAPRLTEKLNDAVKRE